MRSESPPELGPAELDRIASLYGRGAIAIGPQCNVLGISEFARSSLVANRWPIQVHNNQIRIVDPVQHSKLLEQMHQVFCHEQSVGGVMLPNPSKGLPFFITITRPGAVELLLLTVRDPSWVGKEDHALLRQVFGYTRRESELASHLASGKKLVEFTEQNHLTTNTVKSHLKQVFRKAGVRSQMQLVAVVLAVLR